MGEWLSRSRALACHARGRGFKSRLSRSIDKKMALQQNQLKKDLKNFTTIRPQNIGRLMLPFQVRYGSIHSNSKKASNQGEIKSENSFMDKKENDLPIKTDNELKSLIEEETIETTFLLALSTVSMVFSLIFKNAPDGAGLFTGLYLFFVISIFTILHYLYEGIFAISAKIFFKTKKNEKEKPSKK